MSSRCLIPTSPPLIPIPTATLKGNPSQWSMPYETLVGPPPPPAVPCPAPTSKPNNLPPPLPLQRETQARMDTVRDGAGDAYAPPARSSVSSREAKERTAFQKAKDTLTKPLNGVSSQWLNGVAADCDGSCPVCKKVLVVIVVVVVVTIGVVVVVEVVLVLSFPLVSFLPLGQRHRQRRLNRPLCGCVASADIPCRVGSFLPVHNCFFFGGFSASRNRTATTTTWRSATAASCGCTMPATRAWVSSWSTRRYGVLSSTSIVDLSIVDRLS